MKYETTKYEKASCAPNMFQERHARNEMITISIVTPSLNQDKFIEETIVSVLSQKGDFLLDYIVIDGGSVDTSVEIISRYANMIANNSLKSFCRGVSFRWVSEKDNGQVDAIKKGFALAKGDIFCWINSDDIYLSETVLQTVADHFLSDNKLELLTGDGLFIDEQGKEIGSHQTNYICLKKLIFLDYHILQPASFFRKETYNCSPLDERFICAFDANFFIGLISAGVPYLKISNFLAGFRLYPGIKTIRLAKVRYKEQRFIARKYSNCRKDFFISTVYRYFEIVLKEKWKHNRFFQLTFILICKASYRLILGKNSHPFHGVE